MCTPGIAGLLAESALYADEPLPKVMYVFDPMKTLL